MRKQSTVKQPETTPLALTPTDAAISLGISRATLDRQVKAGSVKAIRFGNAVRISRLEIDRLTAGKSIDDMFGELEAGEQAATLERLASVVSDPAGCEPVAV